MFQLIPTELQIAGLVLMVSYLSIDFIRERRKEKREWEELLEE